MLWQGPSRQLTNSQVESSFADGQSSHKHLHFTMLVNGQAVSPVGWWDPRWIEDRVARKLRETASTAPTP